MKTKLISSLAISRESNIVIAQYGELRRQVPLLYLLLILNACAVSYTHFAFAPAWTTIGFLGVLIAACSWRIVRWWRAPGPEQITAQSARKQLVNTTILSGILGAIFLTWSLVMNQYGGSREEAHIALFIAVTVIGCIFCLSYLPSAAMIVTAVVTIPYLIYYIWRGDAVFIAMAFNIALVTGLMVRVLQNSFEGFATTIRSRAELLSKQQETERLSVENERLAHTDVLTGLPNRRYFFGRLDRALEAAHREGARVAVGVLDLDRFKAVNDTYGHAIGDRLLACVAERLAMFCSDRLVLARLGGDEFGALFTGDIEDARGIGQAICDALAEPFAIDNLQVGIGCSAGIAVYPEAGRAVHELFDRADYAAYT